ncbi:hypothetical protein Pmani_036929 [Petrolisthes manimaculis]|uniref:Uncharacterized protein n=1 Tax=Petrolisthes manimaculis TaxID=1843537 RepID=A0AAE1NJ85_9EUCA|nr:hypothetical protein Pmani_036929 [Petrolisthes manimaculis]
MITAPPWRLTQTFSARVGWKGARVRWKGARVGWGSARVKESDRVRWGVSGCGERQGEGEESLWAGVGVDQQEYKIRVHGRSSDNITVYCRRDRVTGEVTETE